MRQKRDDVGILCRYLILYANQSAKSETVPGKHGHLVTLDLRKI